MTPRSLLRDLALVGCALAAAWPLTELVRSSSATLPAALAVCAVVLVGALCRLRPLPGAVTLAVQLLTALVATGIGMGLRGISPAPGNLRSLTTSLGTTIQHETTPLPGTPAILAMIIAATALVALVVDFVGGTARMALFTALPIAAPFVLTATAVGHALSVRYFIVAALAWALLLLSQSGDERSRQRRSTPALALFTMMAVAAVVAALVITPAVPQRPAPALASGGDSGLDTSIDFSKSLDLRKSLHSTNSAPVLEYTTDAAQPGPLRVTTSSTYRDGVWQAESESGPFTTVQAKKPIAVPGLAASVPTTPVQTQVTANGIHAPLIASPGPITQAVFGSGNESFRMMRASGVPVLSRPAPVYATLSRAFTAAARPTSDTAVTTATPTVTSADLDVSTVPAEARSRLTTLSTAAERGASSRFAKAVALQRYLRLDGGFRYSLDAPSAQENGRDLDPVSAFLETKQGYCTQFATAMIMAARLQGIPARMAIGFLPGTTVGTTRTVHASDAHAWPELYFPGMGWTRFDPTAPSRSGAPPAYAPDAAASASASSQSSTSTSTSSAASTSTSSTPPPSTSTAPATHHAASSSWVGTALKVVLGLILLGAILSILPLAGRSERGRLLRRARTDEEVDEGHWHAMRWHLADLGFPLTTGLSPRATVQDFRERHPDAPDHLVDALGRTAESLEASRYAPQGTYRSADSATDRVVTAARDAAARPARVRALLVPASGLEFLRRLVRRR